MLATQKPLRVTITAAALAGICTLALAAEPADRPDAPAAAAVPSERPKKPGYHTDHFRIKPILSITQQFDDNIFATDRDTVSDWITVISPQLKVESTWDRHRLVINSGARAGRYWDFDAENYLDYWLSAEGRYNVSDVVELFGGMGISREHEGRDSPEVSIGGLEPTIYRSTNAHAGIRVTVDNTTWRVGGTYEKLDFDDVGAGTSAIFNDDRDRDLFGFGVRATRRLTADHSIFAQALYDRRDYDLSQDQNGFRRDSDGYRAAIGVKSDFGERSKAEAYFGLMRQVYDDDRFDDVSKADFGGRVTLYPADNLKLTSRLQRSLNETTDIGSPGYLLTSLSGRLEYRATPRLTPHVGFRYAIADYLQTGREDDNYSAEVGAKYFLSRNTYVVAGVRHSARDSNDANRLTGSNDFEKNSIFITLTSLGYPLSEPLISDFNTDAMLEIGALLVSDDAVRFGRYSGLTDEGLEWNANLDLRSNDGESSYAQIRGLDLGLDSRSLEIGWGTQGSYDAHIDYRQIPFNDFTGKTVFDGSGSDSLTLPAGWVDGDSTADFTQLSSSLKEVEIGTLRKRLGAGTRIHATDSDWSASFGYQTESKEGIEQRAGLIGTSPGNGRSALLPVPVDYTTNVVKAALGYAAQQTQVDIAYEGSFFYNNLRSVAWENPFDDTGPRGTNGAISLPPDNQYHQVSVTAGHSLSDATRLTGMLSIGAMLQDESFVPDTVDPALTPFALPRDSLEGEVWLYNGLLAVNSRPLRGLNLSASYRLQKRENETPSDTFNYFVNDSFGGLTNSPASDTNRPYSYDKRTAKLKGSYRFSRIVRLGGELTRETMKRDPSEVHKTTEDAAELNLRLRPRDDLQLSLRSGVSQRDGSRYETIPGENPLLRKYNISDRDRITAGLGMTFQPTDRLVLGANVDFSDDDYDATAVGLTEAGFAGVTLDAAYEFDDALSAHAYIGHERYESEQLGSQVPVTADWQASNDDTVNSLGVGLRWKRSARLELGAEYALSDSRGETTIRSNNALPPVSQFPDLRSQLHTLGLYADYRLRKDTRLKFTYGYERFDADDWALDNVQTDTIPEVLLLGEDNPSYRQHVFGISLISRF